MPVWVDNWCKELEIVTPPFGSGIDNAPSSYALSRRRRTTATKPNPAKRGIIATGWIGGFGAGFAGSGGGTGFFSEK